MLKRVLKADTLGRITIPKDLRNMLNIDGVTRVEVLYDNEQLVIPKIKNRRQDMEECFEKLVKEASNSGVITNKEFNEFKDIVSKLLNEID